MLLCRHTIGAVDMNFKWVPGQTRAILVPPHDPRHISFALTYEPAPLKKILENHGKGTFSKQVLQLQ